MNTILCKIAEEDAKKLTSTIIEVEACRVLYDEARTKIDCTPMALKTILEYYMEKLKEHKQLWKNILIEYLDEDEVTKFYSILRFDTTKKVIFKVNIEGCVLCEK